MLRTSPQTAITFRVRLLLPGARKLDLLAPCPRVDGGSPQAHPSPMFTLGSYVSTPTEIDTRTRLCHARGATTQNSALRRADVHHRNQTVLGSQTRSSYTRNRDVDPPDVDGSSLSRGGSSGSALDFAADSAPREDRCRRTLWKHGEARIQTIVGGGVGYNMS